MFSLPTSPEGSPQQYVRRFARHRCSRAMRVRFQKNNEELLLQGRCTVISEGGFEALISGELPLGRIVTIEFYLDGLADPIPLSARVMNHYGFSFGFQFIAPSSLQRSIIADFFYEELHSEPLS
jgi:hypothetical protein